MYRITKAFNCRFYFPYSISKCNHKTFCSLRERSCEEGLAQGVIVLSLCWEPDSCLMDEVMVEGLLQGRFALLPPLPGQSVVMSITNWDWAIPLQAAYLLFMSVFAHVSAVWLIAPSTRGGMVRGEKCLFTLITLECDATVLYGCILFGRNGISASVLVLHTQGCKISEEFPKGIYCQWGTSLFGQSLCCLPVCLVLKLFLKFLVSWANWSWSLLIRPHPLFIHHIISPKTITSCWKRWVLSTVCAEANRQETGEKLR